MKPETPAGCCRVLRRFLVVQNPRPSAWFSFLSIAFRNEYSKPLVRLLLLQGCGRYRRQYAPPKETPPQTATAPEKYHVPAYFGKTLHSAWYLIFWRHYN